MYPKQLLNGRPNFSKDKKRKKSKILRLKKKNNERKTRLSEGYSLQSL